jgi:tRNA nucleotidyltransferase (CCA-adding enzyme)
MNECEKLFTEIDSHILNDMKPSTYLNSLLYSQTFLNTFPFTLLSVLNKIQQSPQHHPEGNVWKHTMLVVDLAAEKKYQSTDKKVFMWSALLHDIGKAPTTIMRKGKYTAYDHDKAGETLSVNFLEQFTDNNEFIYKVSKMIRWHMQLLFVLQDLPFSNIKKMCEETSLEEIALLALCDRLGRSELTSDKIEEEQKNVELFLEKCHKKMR